jgi:hypothetical protein
MPVFAHCCEPNPAIHEKKALPKDINTGYHKIGFRDSFRFAHFIAGKHYGCCDVSRTDIFFESRL